VEKVLLYIIAKSGLEPEEIDAVVKTDGKDVNTDECVKVDDSDLRCSICGTRI